jgi:hypothetical protein
MLQKVERRRFCIQRPAVYLSPRMDMLLNSLYDYTGTRDGTGSSTSASAA